MEAHTIKLAALTADCADIPPDLLDRAIKNWVAKSKWMPTAADLIGLAKELVDRPVDALVQQLQDHCDKLNKYRWVADSGQPYFVNKRDRADGSTEHFVDRAV